MLSFSCSQAFFPGLKYSCNLVQPIRTLCYHPSQSSVIFIPTRTLTTQTAFSRACGRLQIFLRLPPVANFPALAAGYKFPAFINGHMFSMSSDWFVCPCLTLVINYCTVIGCVTILVYGLFYYVHSKRAPKRYHRILGIYLTSFRAKKDFIYNILSLEYQSGVPS